MSDHQENDAADEELFPNWYLILLSSFCGLLLAVLPLLRERPLRGESFVFISIFFVAWLLHNAKRRWLTIFAVVLVLSIVPFASGLVLEHYFENLPKPLICFAGALIGFVTAMIAVIGKSFLEWSQDVPGKQRGQ